MIYPVTQQLYQYFSISHQLIQKMVKSSQPESKYIYSSVYYLSQVESFHSRKVFNMFDLLDSMGGVTEILIVLVGIILFPISK